MAYRRKYPKRTSKRKSSRRSYRKRSTSKYGGNIIMKFKRTFNAGNWAFSTITTAGFYRQVSPAFTDIPSYLEYTNLFDAVKITGVKCTLLPKFTDVGGVQAATGALTSYNPQYYISIGGDKYSQGSAPTGTYGVTAYNDFCEKSSFVKTYRGDRPITWFFRPNAQNNMTASLATMPFPWISTVNPAQPALGSLVFIHDANFIGLNTSGFSIDIIYTLYFKCRGSK